MDVDGGVAGLAGHTYEVTDRYKLVYVFLRFYIVEQTKYRSFKLCLHEFRLNMFVLRPTFTASIVWPAHSRTRP